MTDHDIWMLLTGIVIGIIVSSVIVAGWLEWEQALLSEQKKRKEKE